RCGRYGDISLPRTRDQNVGNESGNSRWSRYRLGRACLGLSDLPVFGRSDRCSYRPCLCVVALKEEAYSLGPSGVFLRPLLRFLFSPLPCRWPILERRSRQRWPADRSEHVGDPYLYTTPDY